MTLSSPSCAGLTRASIFFARSLFRGFDGLPGHKRVYARLQRAMPGNETLNYPWSLHSQQPVDAPRVLAERLVGLHFERARVRQLDAEVVGHARRAGGEHDHAGAEKH